MDNLTEITKQATNKQQSPDVSKPKNSFLTLGSLAGSGTPQSSLGQTISNIPSPPAPALPPLPLSPSTSAPPPPTPTPTLSPSPIPSPSPPPTAPPPPPAPSPQSSPMVFDQWTGSLSPTPTNTPFGGAYLNS